MLWSSSDPERLVGLAMRRCYTTKVWEELAKDVEVEGYASYLTESAFRRLEFDVYEHIRALFRVEASTGEVLKLALSHPHVAITAVGEGIWLASMNLRTIVEMARRLHCSGDDCRAFATFLEAISPTAAKCVRRPGEERAFTGQKAGSAGTSATGFRLVVVQHLTTSTVQGYADEKIPQRELLKHSFVTVEVEGISRACSHQLVRHRLFSYSQESQRFSDAVNEEGVMPPSYAGIPDAEATFTKSLGASKEAYARLRSLGIKKEDARFVLPTSLKTKILMTGSMFQVLHAAFYRSRFSDVGNKAQWEINRLFTALYEELHRRDGALPPRIEEL
jgi:hypothetical protein